MSLFVLTSQTRIWMAVSLTRILERGLAALCAVFGMGISLKEQRLLARGNPGLKWADGISIRWVIGRPSLWIAEDFWMLRFRLMVKQGPWLLPPQASEGEAQHGPFCWIVFIGQEDQRLHCG
jgi:hypothetical protein